MANTVLSIVAPCTGGLEQLSATAGTVWGSTVPVRSGSYVYQLTGNSSASFTKTAPITLSSGDHYTCIFVINFDDSSPSSSDEFVRLNFGGARLWSLNWTSDGTGDIEINTNGGYIEAMAAADHGYMGVDEWHTIRVDVLVHATAGKIKLTFNDEPAVEYLNEDTLSSTGSGDMDLVFSGPSQSSIHDQIDCAMLWDTGTVYAPTDLPLDIMKTVPQQPGLASASDLGHALDAYTWAAGGELPWVAGRSGERLMQTVGSNRLSGNDLDDSPRGGPYGDADLDGATVLGASLNLMGSRYGGSSTAHFVYYGHKGETWETGLQKSADLALGTSNVYFEFLMQGSDSHIPDPTNATNGYWRFGMENTGGGQDFEIPDISFVIMYEPGVTNFTKIDGVTGPAKIGGVTSPTKVGGISA